MDEDFISVYSSTKTSHRWREGPGNHEIRQKPPCGRWEGVAEGESDCEPFYLLRTGSSLLALFSPRVVPSVVIGRVHVLERLQLGALESHVHVRVVLVTVVGDRSAADGGHLLGGHAVRRLDRGRGRLLDQTGPGQKAGSRGGSGGRRRLRWRRPGRSGVLQVIVHHDARLGVFAAETRRRRSTTVLDAAALTVAAAVVVRSATHRGRATVHYGLAIVVVETVDARDVDVPASDGQLFLVGQRRAGRRLVLLRLWSAVAVLRFRGVHVHQRTVLPHGHADQHLVAAADRLFELPHGLGAFDFFATRFVTAAAAQRRQVSHAGALSHHRRRPGVASVVGRRAGRRLERARLSAAGPAADRHGLLSLLQLVTVMVTLFVVRPISVLLLSGTRVLRSMVQTSIRF